MKLTVEKVKELAMKNYNQGGDAIVECYEDKQIQELIDRGIDTEKKLMEFFKDNYEIDEEYRKASLYYAYGTTDEKEIEQILKIESEDLNEESESDEEYDPCFGCQACDHSYNCKHCKYGDDGRYESPFDVYTPSELGINVKW